jgi:hypothetical protein
VRTVADRRPVEVDNVPRPIAHRRVAVGSCVALCGKELQGIEPPPGIERCVISLELDRLEALFETWLV